MEASLPPRVTDVFPRTEEDNNKHAGDDRATTLLSRATLERLVLETLQRDMSKQKKSKHKLVRLLSPEALRAAVATAEAAAAAQPASKRARRPHAAPAAAEAGDAAPGAAAAAEDGVAAPAAAAAGKKSRKPARDVGAPRASRARAAPPVAAGRVCSAGEAAAPATAAAAALERDRGGDDGETEFCEEDDDAVAATAAAAAPAGEREAALQRANAAGAAAAAALRPRREAALGAVVPLLAPFVAPAVAARLAAAAAADAPAPAAAAATPPALPRQLLASLRPHQLDGVAFLASSVARGLSPILADEMGLGKTLQAIALIAHAVFVDKQGPHLVVCPLSVLATWQAELARWCPALRPLRCHAADAPGRAALAARLARPASFDVALTTYEALASASGPLGRALRSRARYWRLLVADEAQRAKDRAGGVAAALRATRRCATVLLTGTLLQNDMVELYNLLNLLYPDVFTTAAPFEAAFDLGGCAAAAGAAAAGGARVDARALAAAHAMLSSGGLWLWREKAGVCTTLPPRTDVTLRCPLAPRQRQAYCDALRGAAGLLGASPPPAAAAGPAAAGAGAGGAGAGKLRDLCMRLRLVCAHPRLREADDAAAAADEAADKAADEAVAAGGAAGAAAAAAAADALAAGSGKLALLDRLLGRLRAAGRRVALFSQFRDALDVVERLCRLRGLPTCRLDGATSRARRALDCMLFNRPDSDLFAFLLTTRAGGVGLNLQGADCVVLFDSDWNPAADAQAAARVHRIGQPRPVTVYTLLTAGTVEERVAARARKKGLLADVVARGGCAAHLDAGGAAAGDDDEEADAEPGGAALAAELRHGAAELLRRGAAAAAASWDGATDGATHGATHGGATDEEEAAALALTDAELDGLAGGGGGGAAAALAALAAAGRPAVAPAAPLTRAELEAPPPPLRAFLGPPAPAAAVPAAAAAAAAAKRAAAAAAAQAAQADGPRALRSRQPAAAAAAGGGAQPPAPLALCAPPQLQPRLRRHSSTCLGCGDGGELFLCDAPLCPVAMHAACAGKGGAALRRARAFLCPHHGCSECGATAAAAGGLLFRCDACPAAFCEAHLPEACVARGRVVAGAASRLARLAGGAPPRSAAYVLCSDECAAFAAAGYGFEPGEAEAEEAEAAAAAAAAAAGPAHARPGDGALLLPRPGGAAAVPLPGAKFGELKRFLMAAGVQQPAEPLPGAEPGSRLAATALRNFVAADGAAAYALLYSAAREALLGGLNPFAPDPASLRGLSSSSSSSSEGDGDEGGAGDSSNASGGGDDSGSDEEAPGEDEAEAAAEAAADRAAGGGGGAAAAAKRPAAAAAAAPGGAGGGGGGGGGGGAPRRLPVAWLDAEVAALLRLRAAAPLAPWAATLQAGRSAFHPSRTAGDINMKYNRVTRGRWGEGGGRAGVGGGPAAAPPRPQPQPQPPRASRPWDAGPGAGAGPAARSQPPPPSPGRGGGGWPSPPPRCPPSPAYRPTSPVYRPASPAHQPSSPAFRATSPPHHLQHYPSPPAYCPASPAYQPPSPPPGAFGATPDHGRQPRGGCAAAADAAAAAAVDDDDDDLPPSGATAASLQELESRVAARGY